jgi:hypothetical protein
MRKTKNPEEKEQLMSLLQSMKDKVGSKRPLALEPLRHMCRTTMLTTDFSHHPTFNRTPRRNPSPISGR